MESHVLIAGIISSVMCVGHVVIGKRVYINPVMESTLEPKLKTLCRALFDCSTVYLIVATLFLLAVGMGQIPGFGSFLVPLFIGLVNFFCSLIFLVISRRADVSMFSVTMLQWLSLLVVSSLCFVAIV